MVDTSIVSSLINGQAISEWIQGNKYILLIMIAIGWLVYTILQNKEKIDEYLQQRIN